MKLERVTLSPAGLDRLTRIGRTHCLLTTSLAETLPSCVEHERAGSLRLTLRETAASVTRISRSCIFDDLLKSLSHHHHHHDSAFFARPCQSILRHSFGAPWPSEVQIQLRHTARATRSRVCDDTDT